MSSGFADLLLAAADRLLPPSSLTSEESRITAIAVVGARALSQSALFWLLSRYEADREVLVSATARVLRGTVSALTSAAKSAPRERVATNKKARSSGR